jgi:hypothetical protein
MPITELECPRCGVTVEFGLPLDATVDSLTAGDRPEQTTADRKTRRLVCRRDHDFAVTFSY